MNDFIKFMLSDSEILSVYGEIDKHNKFPANHGMKHIYGVLDISNKISVKDYGKPKIFFSSLLLFWYREKSNDFSEIWKKILD